MTTEGLRFEPHARGLRLGWAEALNAARDTGAAAVTLRIGMQHDLVGSHIGEWIGDFRSRFPETAFYVEADYSTQMCNDLMAGSLDLAMIFSPRPHPDLHFETLGELSYRMVSTETEKLNEVNPETYILANYSPAFARAHAALHPSLSAALVASGRIANLAGLLLALGGTTYVLEETATELVHAAQCRHVRRAPAIPQTVFAAIHLRNRHRSTHRRMIGLLRTRFSRGAR